MYLGCVVEFPPDAIYGRRETLYADGIGFGEAIQGFSHCMSP